MPHIHHVSRRHSQIKQHVPGSMEPVKQESTAAAATPPSTTDGMAHAGCSVGDLVFDCFHVLAERTQGQNAPWITAGSSRGKQQACASKP